jgi:hypothetical protein
VTSREARQADSDVFRHGFQEDLDNSKRDGDRDEDLTRVSQNIFLLKSAALFLSLSRGEEV